MTPIFGHDVQRSELKEAASGARMHHGWLFTGPQGIGKASLARRFAASLLAGTSEDVADDQPTAHLMAAGSHPDYAELTRLEKDSGDLARSITVDQVRALGRLLETAPSIAARRVIIIDSADDLERGGANALLKSLEEPPKNVIFLLVSHAPSRLLPTIRSRCRVLRFSCLNEGDMRRAIRSVRSDIAERELDQLVEAGRGAPGRALALAGLGLDEISHSLERIAQAGDPDNAERLALAKALASRSAKLRFEAMLNFAPDFIAAQTRSRQGRALRVALDAWEQARDLAAAAIPLSLDPATVVFELCGHVASLAPVSEVKLGQSPTRR
jgi:DNA polymerase III subunit delta'